MSFLNVLTGNSWKGVLFHLVLVTVVGFGLINYFFNGYLPTETRHGEGIDLPSVENMSYSKAKSLLELKGLVLVVRDTVYSPKHNKSAIVSQLPAAKKEVKLGRKVYVDLNRSDIPTVILSDALCREGGGLILTDIGTAQITAQGLELVPEIIYINKPNNNFVYKAKINSNTLRGGMEIPIGSKIILYTGNGKTR
jgi:hypothetical protein